MGVLDEVIRRLEETSAPLENRKWSTIDDCVELLIELNKPVQYVVTLTKSGTISRLNGEEFILAEINGVNIFYGITSETIREASIREIQIHAKAMGLPPITIDQITFVEV